MDHFVAYHSVHLMGHDYIPEDEVEFYSKKIGLLNKAIGNMVWAIKGVKGDSHTIYTLFAAFVPDCVSVKNSYDNYRISGPIITKFKPPVPLNDLLWFPSLRKSQSNFSLGFNRINDGNVIQALIAIQKEYSKPCDERIPVRS